MSKTKFDFIKTVERSIRDDAQKFTKSVIVTSKVLNVDGNTEFLVPSVLGFYSGEDIVISDFTMTKFMQILSVNETAKKLTFYGDQTLFENGATIRKTDILQFIEQAILTYSKYRENNKVFLVTSPDDNIISVPTDWTNGFSSINYVEYPLSADTNIYLDNTLYNVILQNDGTYKIEFAYTLTSELNLAYTTVHGWVVEDPVNENPYTTIPDADFNSVCDIASAYFALALAGVYAQSVDPAINADAVNYADKVNQYIKLYNEYLNKAASWLGLDIVELKKGNAQDEGYSMNQMMPYSIYDDEVLILTNYYYNY